MRRSFLIVAVGLLVAVLLGASAFAADDAAKKVYYSLYDNSDMFISLVRNAIEAEAKEQGLSTVPADAQKDQNRQLSQIEQFVAQGAQVLIINPVDATSAPAIIDAAKGRKLILFNKRPEDKYIDGKNTFYVGSDESVVGPIQAEMIDAYFKAKGVDKKGGLKYVLFMGEPGHEATVKRTAGVKKGLEDLGYKLEAVYEDTAMWSRAEAQNKMQTIVAKNFDVVICNNDEMALGVIEALRAAGKLESVPVVGVDATPDGQASVKKGEMMGTVLQDADKLGRTLVRLQLDLMAGKELPPETSIPFRKITKEDL